MLVIFVAVLAVVVFADFDVLADLQCQENNEIINNKRVNFLRMILIGYIIKKQINTNFFELILFG
jgi:hypothetical protein